MAWYTTGTIAVSGTTVTGTGTNFLDNTQSIGPGQALLIPGSGTVKMYEVASVQSATKLTLKTSAGTVAAGQAYAILSFYTDSVPDFARRLAAQLSYYQSQMDGWQQIMTGTGSITMTAPDGTTVTISSFSKLTADVAAALPQMGNLATAGVTDINNLGPVSGGIGIWDANNSASYSLPNIPEAQAGVLEVLVGGGFRGTQRYTTRYGNIYIRSLTASWNATSPSWGPWCLSGFTYRNQSSLDLNTLTNAAFVGGTLTNGPATMGNATCFISSSARFDGALIFQTAQYTTTGRVFTRSCVSGTWTAWAESLTTNNGLQLSGGTMTGGITMGGSAGIDLSGSNLSTINIMSWVSTAAARASLANAGFSQPSSTVFDLPGASRTMRVICATAVVTLNAGSTGTITYPNAFPNACNAVVACNGDRNTTGGNVNIIGTSALGGFNFIAENSASSGVRINYIAVGY